jgi:hypothetical protein
MQKLNTTHTRRSIMNMLATSSAIATLPALTSPAQASDAIGPDHPDAELLRLGALFEQVEREWAAQSAVDRKSSDAWEAACISAGLPRVEPDSMPDEEFFEYTRKRGLVRTQYSAAEENDVNECGASTGWDDIQDRLFTLAAAILPRRAVTAAGFAVQARAVVFAAAELWDRGVIPEDSHEKLFIEAACAFLGIMPAPIAMMEA